MDRATLVKTLKIFGTLTVVITLVGYFFGNVLGTLLEPTQVPTLVTGAPQADDSEMDGEVVADEQGDSVIAEEVLDLETFYVIQLGVFSSLDNAAGLLGTVTGLALPADVIRLDGNFLLYSHVVGSRSQLMAVEQLLEQNNVDFFTRQDRAASDELAWQYFLMAANEQPFQIDGDFINEFDNDELHIFGMFNALSSSSFEPLAEERQNMLMAIFNWLHS